MICHICNNLSFSVICQKCQKNLLEPDLKKQYLEKDFFTYYFYDLSSIDFLIKSKYKPIGSEIFNILAKNSFSKFAQNFNYNSYAIPIDDISTKGYSHSAILAKNLKSRYIKPTYSKLRVLNSDIKYSGKSRDYRLKNLRDFSYSGKENIDVILVDDVVTTGITLISAKNHLKSYNINVLFGIVLTSARF